MMSQNTPPCLTSCLGSGRLPWKAVSLKAVNKGIIVQVSGIRDVKYSRHLTFNKGNRSAGEAEEPPFIYSVH